jgi:adenylate cyclase
VTAARPRLRRLAVAATRHAARVLPARRAQWAEAMRRELDYIEDDRAALRWALGCVVSSYRTRLAGLPRIPTVVGPASKLMRTLSAVLRWAGRGPRVLARGSSFLARGSTWLLLALLAVLVGLRIADWRPFTLVRDNLFDGYQTAAPATPGSDRVVVIEIDEASLAALGRWPWSRAVMADLTRHLTAAGAIVGFDMVFAEPESRSPDADDRFAQAIAAGRVVLGQAFDAAGDAALPPVAPIALRGPPASAQLPAFGGLVNPLPVLVEHAAGRGFFGLGVLDPDGVVRHLPMLSRLSDRALPAADSVARRDRLIPGLALELARVARSADGIAVDATPFGISGIEVGGVTVPTGRSGEVWPNFSIASPRGLSVIGVLDGGAAPGSFAGSLAGKIAIVGGTAAGLHDLRQTPVGPMPGVFLIARALNDMLSGTLLWRPAWSDLVEIALMIASGLVVIVAAGVAGRRFFVTLWLVMTAATFGASGALYRSYGLLIDPSASAIATTALVFAVLLISVARQDRPSVALVR